MATRLYLPFHGGSGAAVPFSPVQSASWEAIRGGGLVRDNTKTTAIADAIGTLSDTADGGNGNYDLVDIQWLSLELTAGQTVTGSQAVKAQVQGSKPHANGGAALAVGIRVINITGPTVKKTVLDVTRDNIDLVVTTITNRQFTATSAATNYTTVAGDYLVIEMGVGGDPVVGGSNHKNTLRLGDNGSDLPEDNTDTSTTLVPWVELADTLSFVGAAATSLLPNLHRSQRALQRR